MARTRTLTQLIAEVRDRADIEGSQHITDAQITRYINQSGAALHAKLVDFDQDEFVEISTGPCLAPESDGATHVEMPAYRVLVVSASINGVDTRLDRFNWTERPGATDAGRSGPPHMYRWVGNEIVIVPPLPTGTTVTVYSIGAFVDMSAGSDTYDGRDGWEEWVVWDAAIKCLVKEESDARQAMAERDAVFARIKGQMLARDLHRPARVQDVRPKAWEY